MDDEMNNKNRNSQMNINTTSKLYDYIAKIKYNINYREYEISTAFFIKLKLNENNNETPFLCTAYHTFYNKLPQNFYNEGGIISLIFYRNKETIKKIDFCIKNEHIKRKIIFFEPNDLDLIFIEILNNDEIPDYVKYFELNEKNDYFNNYLKLIREEIIIFGFHIEETIKNGTKVKIEKVEPNQSHGHIAGIETVKKNYHYNIVYDAETSHGVSGSPVCIIKNNKYQLIGYHVSSYDIEKKNMGTLFPTLNIIKTRKHVDEIPINNDSININVNNDLDEFSELNIKILEDTLKKRDIYNKDNIALLLYDSGEKPENDDNFKIILSYNEYIFIYYEELIKEMKKIKELTEINNERNKINQRFNICYKYLGEYLSKSVQNKLKLNSNKILEILKIFKEHEKNYKQIINDINDIIIFFNDALKLGDSILLASSTYFIASFLDILNKKYPKYSENKVTFYCRIKLDFKMIDNIKEIKDEDNTKKLKLKIISFKTFFIAKIINYLTFFNRARYDIANNLSLIWDLALLPNDGYNTLITIHQNFDNDNIIYPNNIYKLSYSDVLICPYSFFEIINIKINKDYFTAELELNSIGIKNTFNKEVKEIIYEPYRNIIELNE